MDKIAIVVFNCGMRKAVNSVHRSKNILLPLLISIAGAVLNAVCSRYFFSLGVPLFLDTIFTVAVTFYCGLPWGALTGALSNIIMARIMLSVGPDYFYALCNIVVALVTALFIRLFPEELGLPAPRATLHSVMDRVILLTILSMALSIVMSVTGGIIGAFIKIFAADSPNSTGPEVVFKTALLNKNLSVFLVEILARIPVNVLDRIISVFAAYLISGALGAFRPGATGAFPAFFKTRTAYFRL